ncbi:hypothetical protein CK203_046011 [Vitis vinifera]|uniref:Retrovirus-related Pol polyprotein from transposon RE1 n=1 Tax=Vitis vinifera TaxID=29760 RepID=A0A438HGV6_VITVI|nr:hypothetical protein CK203_046011 [Vitis vinifera]
MAYSTQGIFISQQKYVTDLLAETGKIGCKPVSTPMDPNHKLGKLKKNQWWIKECTRGWLVGSYTLLTLGQTSPTRFPSGSKINSGIVLFLEIILDDLRIKWDGPMKLYCDNKSTINIAHNPIQHDRTKHIEIDRHFIKEKLEEGVVYVLCSIRTSISSYPNKRVEQFNVSRSCIQAGNGRHLFLSLREC